MKQPRVGRTSVRVSALRVEICGHVVQASTTVLLSLPSLPSQGSGRCTVTGGVACGASPGGTTGPDHR
jgi:hypothetical protein